MNSHLLISAVLALLVVAPGVGAARSAPPSAAAAPSEADWRTPDPDNVLVIDTSKGRVIVELTPEVAPQSAARVRDLARSGFYDGRAFFRVIDDFMDQTGDPTDTGTGGSTKPDLPAEFTFRRGADTPIVVVNTESGLDSGFIGPMPVISQTMDLAILTADHRVTAWPTYCPGVIGMARAQDPNSGNSQFFLMRGTHTSLDKQYTAVGRVIFGMDTVSQIKTGEPVEAPQDKMISVHVLADMPAARRPVVRVIDPRGPWFQAMVRRVRADKVVGLSMCDLELPSQVK